MTTITGTVLPLVFAFSVVLVLLIAARNPGVPSVPRNPVAGLLSICAGGYALFAAAMASYCFAQPSGGGECARGALTEAGALAAIVIVPASVATRIMSRRRTRNGAAP